MPRYIDADTIVERLDEIQPFAGNKAANAAINLCKDIVRNAPTVSPDEVRGRGFNKRAEYPSLFTCSVCDFDCDDTYYCSTHNFKYCPNCGAKMEVEGDA